MENQIFVKDIISFLEASVLSVSGETSGVSIKYIRPSELVDKYTLDWVNHINPNKQEIVENSKSRVLLVDKEVKYSDQIKEQNKTLIFVDNPKLVIAKIANKFFVDKIIPSIHPSATIHHEAILGENIYIGPNVVIGKCEIGTNVIIHGNAYLYDNCIIKENVELHAGVVIGNDAHNFVHDTDGTKIPFPHLGGVLICKNVVVGAQTCISSGVLCRTIIGEGTKIAQLVFIGANNIIGANCAIRPNVMTSGSVEIGVNTVLASSVTIRDQRKIGNNCFIGMGAVVTKDIPKGETWFGNPAKKMIIR